MFSLILFRVLSFLSFACIGKKRAEQYKNTLPNKLSCSVILLLKSATSTNKQHNPVCDSSC